MFHTIIVPGGNVGTIIAISIVGIGVIVYALYDKIKVIPMKVLRPALVVFAAIVILIIAYVQPWSVKPQSVMAKGYTATESLLSYRATISGITEDSSIAVDIECVYPARVHATIVTDGETDEFMVVGDRQYIKSGNTSRTIIIAFQIRLSLWSVRRLL